MEIQIEKCEVSSAWHGMAQHRMVRHNVWCMVRRDTVLCDMAAIGVVGKVEARDRVTGCFCG